MFILFFASLGGAQDFYLEDINFSYDSQNVIDDLKQIPRLSEILIKDPELILEICGHTDSRGSAQYNRSLSMKRAQAVKEKFIQQGIAPNQIIVKGYGEDRFKDSSSSGEAHFINRRVVLSVYKLKDGGKDYYFKDNIFIKPFKIEFPDIKPAAQPLVQPSPAPIQQPTSDPEMLQRLDRLEKLLSQKPEPQPTLTQTASQAQQTPLPLLENKYGTILAGIGSDDGSLTGGIEGKLFLPFANQFAFQAGARANINDEVKEYQIDIGVVGKYERFQLGVFTSTLFADLENYDRAGNLSQFGLSAAYLIESGSIGAFMTKAIEDEDVISKDSHYVSWDLITTETYLKVRDKVGFNFDYLLECGLSIDGDIAWVDADDTDVSGRLKLGYPLVSEGGLRLFLQGSYADGFIGDDDDFTVIAGIELSNRLFTKRPPCSEVRPMMIPTVSYELKTRTRVLESDINLLPEVSIAASTLQGPAPLAVSFVADASDPDGSIESYIWDFGDGTADSGTEVNHTFTAIGTYLVTLTVTDNDGGRATAQVVISTVNLLPNVSIAASTLEGYQPLSVTFTGNASDSDGSIAAYSWNFGDGTTDLGAEVIHTFTTAGTYQVNLTVTDNDGGIKTETVYIRVKTLPF
ncbi:MAG: PKD domain-containing protein [Desulfobacterales bacterium]|nr:PKD domain-containing protein [Desulfobacterales bacterium]